jgi:hypothetical protein
MAAYEVALSKHATLAAATVDTVTLTENYKAVEVKNRGAAGDIYFTMAAVAPVVGANDTYVVGPGESLVLAIPPRPGQPDAVKLISAGTPAYSVTGVTP